MNDLLKILPEMLTGSALDDKLRTLPEYDENIIQKSIPERLIALQNLYQIFLPNRMSREIYSKMYLSLLRSLQKKQSIIAVRQYNENARAIRSKSFESIIGGSDSFTIIGPSGIGKSSAVSRAINILTEAPTLEIGNTKVIACLQVQTPADSSVKGLLLEILRKVDEVLQTNYHAFAVRSHATNDMLISSVSQVALNHLGLLVIDEIQNVVNSKNGKIIVGTLTQLINNSGVSICMVGTPEATSFFEQSTILARRSLGLSYTTMRFDDEFRYFCHTILSYCYVKQPPTIDESLYLWLYQHSSGNASIVVSIIHDAQEIAILENVEQLDTSTLNLAYKQRLGMIHNHIEITPVKAPSIKKKPSKPPAIENCYRKISDNIYQIAMDAKASGTDIVEKLKHHEISILEVSI